MERRAVERAATLAGLDLSAEPETRRLLSAGPSLRDHVNLALDSSMFLEAATMSSDDIAEATQAFL